MLCRRTPRDGGYQMKIKEGYEGLVVALGMAAVALTIAVIIKLLT